MTLLAYLLLVLAVLGISVALLVLRADPKRWDNRVFAALAIVDSLTEAARCFELLRGHGLSEAHLLHFCHIGSIILAYLTIEFAYSYPFDRCLPVKYRVGGIGFSVLTLILAFHPSTAPFFQQKTTYFYFLPYFAITLALLFRNARVLEKNSKQTLGTKMVMVAIALRWSFAMAAFVVFRNVSALAFERALLVEATVGVFISYVLLSYAILHYQLFRVGGFLAILVLHAGFAVVLLSLLGILVDLALATATGPALVVALTTISLVPLVIVAVMRFLWPQIEERIDPQRARMKDALARIVSETSGKLDPKEIAEDVERALAEIAHGKARFVHAANLPPDLSAQLGGMLEAHIFGASPRELIIPVRRGASLFGALIVSGDRVDRDVIDTAVRIANHFALKLENYALFSEMLNMKSQLEEASRLAALGSFAAAIAHDIRTPLTSVQMNVQILRGKVQLPPDDMEYFDIALDELKRLNSNISELLDYAKPVQVKKSPVDLRELVEDAAKGVEPLLSDRRLELSKEHEADLPPVLGDASRIRQVLLNLLDNAANACDRGGAITLRTKRESREKIALEVADSGKGIEPDHLAKIFEPFFTTRADGTGLGLAIAQKLVRAHGGEIKVTSTVGKGSTFTILLPAA